MTASDRPVLPEDIAIEAGKAQLVLFEALAELATAMVRLERVSMTIARRLDAAEKSKK
jgi:hypothetical protein